jgi:PadR family transcriptional regulator PadR
MDTQLKKGVLDMCVLGILNKEDAYGYIIYQRINAILGISESTIYPILRRFVKAGYLRSYLKPSSTGPARKYFSITFEGRNHYDDLIIQWKKFEETINRHVVRSE